MGKHHASNADDFALSLTPFQMSPGAAGQNNRHRDAHGKHKETNTNETHHTTTKTTAKTPKTHPHKQKQSKSPQQTTHTPKSLKQQHQTITGHAPPQPEAGDTAKWPPKHMESPTPSKPLKVLKKVKETWRDEKQTQKQITNKQRNHLLRFGLIHFKCNWETSGPGLNQFPKYRSLFYRRKK